MKELMRTIIIIYSKKKKNPIRSILKGSNVMPAVHSCRVYLARVLGESCLGWDWASATLCTLAESSQFWHATQGDSQARCETLWLVHYWPLKKRDLNEARHEHRDYTRGSKARRVFPSTFSLSPCLGFPRWECTAGITDVRRSLSFHISFSDCFYLFANRFFLSNLNHEPSITISLPDM